MTPTANGSKINVIMGGGGVRLSAYVGALTAFRDMGVTFGAIAAASAGSIVGTFLAAGWPVERMYATLLETDFAAFKDITLKGLLLEGGLYSGNVFEAWVDRQVEGARFRGPPPDLFWGAGERGGGPWLSLLQGPSLGLAAARLGGAPTRRRTAHALDPRRPRNAAGLPRRGRGEPEHDAADRV